jgi:hypothetical protein
MGKISPRVKFVIGIVIIVSISLLQGYMSWKAGPAVAKQYIAYNQTHPMSWLDFGLGAALMFLTMMVVFVGISLYESHRFDKTVGGGTEGGPQGSGDGGQRKKLVRLPMSRKVVDIGDWRKAPTDGHIHRGAVPVTA